MTLSFIAGQIARRFLLGSIGSGATDRFLRHRSFTTGVEISPNFEAWALLFLALGKGDDRVPGGDMKLMNHTMAEQMLSVMSICTLIAASLWASSSLAQTNFVQSQDLLDSNDAAFFEGVVGNGCQDSENSLEVEEPEECLRPEARRDNIGEREFVVTNTFFQSWPILALSSEEDMTMQAAAKGEGESGSLSVREVLNRVRRRAEMLCLVNGYQGATRYHFGYENLAAYMNFDQNGVLDFADQTLLQPVSNESTSGTARGFVWVRCYR